MNKAVSHDLPNLERGWISSAGQDRCSKTTQSIVARGQQGSLRHRKIAVLIPSNQIDCPGEGRETQRHFSSGSANQFVTSPSCESAYPFRRRARPANSGAPRCPLPGPRKSHCLSTASQPARVLPDTTARVPIPGSLVARHSTSYPLASAWRRFPLQRGIIFQIFRYDSAPWQAALAPTPATASVAAFSRATVHVVEVHELRKSPYSMPFSSAHSDAGGCSLPGTP